MNEYDYDYHNLAENADELYGDEYYYDDGTDEPWDVDPEDIDTQDEYRYGTNQYQNYYHDIIDELDD